MKASSRQLPADYPSSPPRGEPQPPAAISYCPICKKAVSTPADAAGPFFPFCSDRCKLIDLGRWLDGKYQIPVAPSDPAAATDLDDPALP